MILTLCAIIGFLIYFIIEVVLHNKNLKKFPIRILVNGTRGKTTVTKYLVAILNANGIKTVGRSTGSEAQIIYPDRNEPFVRKRKARITEVIRFIKNICSNNSFSSDNNLDGYKALVIECMALSEENQKIFSNHLIKPTHVVITNSYVDHIVEIGETKEQTMHTLASSIYEDSKLFTNEKEYKPYAMKKKASFILVENKLKSTLLNLISKYEKEHKVNMPLHLDNLLLAIEVAKSLGVKVEDALEPALSAIGDKGLKDSIRTKNNVLFIPSFSINDFQCMSDAIKDAYQDNKELNVIFNNRKDREYRIIQFVKVLKENKELVYRVFCIGDYPKKVRSYLSKQFKKEKDILFKISAVTDDQMIQIIKEANDKQIFIGLGNIKGSGEYLVTNEANL